MDAIAGALIAVVVGSPIAYVLGTRRARLERLYDQQAMVISELFKRLYGVQQAFVIWAKPLQALTVDRDHQRQQASERLDDLRDYFYSHSVWLDPETADKVEAFLGTAFEMGFTYLDALNERGHPRSHMGRDAGNRMIRDLAPARRQLEQDFRAILRPAPLYAAPLRVLAGLLSRDKKGDSQE